METYKIGEYIVNRKRIGKGSFSKIYKGYHKETKKVIAVKKIETDNIKKINDNIEREINVMKKLNHPNILKLYDVVYDYPNNYIYLIIEYCELGDFSKFLNKRPLKEKHAKRYIKQLADGLKYLLNNNIMHRDLKPHNILLSSNNQIKLSDFGFARYFERNKMVETLCGSPMYMAPEIMKFHEYTNKSDLWSVGVILYETLTGRLPFKANTFYGLMKTISKKNMRIPQEISLSKDCIDLLYSLLEKNPKKRISWVNFFHHPWFIDNERICNENRLLSINSMTSQTTLKQLIQKNEKMNHSFYNLCKTQNKINNENNTIETEVKDGIELRFEDVINPLEEDVVSDDDGETVLSNDDDDEDINVGQNILHKNKYFYMTSACNKNYFSNSPIFNSIKDNSFVIVQTPPNHIVSSDITYNSNNLLKNVKGYINSSISLLKDSISYISGNHSI